MSSQAYLDYELDMGPKSRWITATPTASAKTSYVYMQECGDFDSGSRYYTTREGLSSYLIKCTLSGEGILEYRGQTYTMKAGQFFWIDCQYPQSYRTSSETGAWHALWVHFYGSNSASYYEHFLSLNNGSCVAELPAANSVTACIHSLLLMYEEGESSLAADIRASGLLTIIMTECIASVTKREDRSKMPECIADARRFLSDHHTEHVTLDDLALRYSMNKYYFQKLFKRFMGFTPNEFVILTRLNRAKELLRTTARPISEICGDVGIANPNHFINLFKKHEGMTPNTFRKIWYNTQVPAREGKSFALRKAAWCEANT